VSGAVHVIGLTGGIGAGKSTVAQALAGRGALIVDADLIAREVVAPHGPAYEPLVARFGPGIVSADRTINRPALASIAFNDPKALADLNGITHPAIWAEMGAQIEAHADSDGILVLDYPLLRADNRDQWPLEAIVVVDTPIEVAIERLVRFRGLDADDARARVAAQISREERRALADVIIDNGGDQAQLAAEVDRAWTFLMEHLG